MVPWISVKNCGKLSQLIGYILLIILCFSNIAAVNAEPIRETHAHVLKAKEPKAETGEWEAIEDWGPGGNYSFDYPRLETTDIETNAHLAWVHNEYTGPHLCMVEFKAMYLGRLANGVWQVSEVPVSNTTISHSADYQLCVDDQGNDHIFYYKGSEFGGAMGGIYHLRYDGSQWTTPVMLTGNFTYDFQAQRTPNGTIYLLCRNLLWIGDSTGNGTLIEIPGIGMQTWGTRLIWRGNGTIEIFNRDLNENLNFLRSTDNGLTWSSLITLITVPRRPDSQGWGFGMDPMIDLDANGDYHVAFLVCDAWGPSSPDDEDWYLIYARQNDSVWASQVVLAKIVDKEKYEKNGALVVTSDNKAHVFWQIKQWAGKFDRTTVYHYALDAEGNPSTKKTVTRVDGYSNCFKAILLPNDMFQLFLMTIKDYDTSSTAGFEIVLLIGSLMAIVILRRLRRKLPTG